MKFSVAFALVSAACVSSVANGDRLREYIQQQMDLTAQSKAATMESAMGMYTLPKDCTGAESPDSQNRKCERGGSSHSVNCKKCTQRCHIWGDPHIAPFIKKGSTNVFHGAGNWTLYSAVSKSPKSDQRRWVTAGVEYRQSAIGNKPWVMYAYIKPGNGTEILAKKGDDCKNADTREDVVVTFGVVSDMAYKNHPDADEDIEVEVRIKCRNKHNVWALEIIVDVIDEQAQRSTRTDGKYGELSAVYPMNMSTTYLSQDTGACVDWIRWGYKNMTEATITQADYDAVPWNDGRNSDQKLYAGKKCTCNADCAAWGDPYVNSFAQNPGGNKEERNEFQIPGPNGRSQAQEIAYSAEVFATQMQMDRCEMIQKVKVWYMNGNGTDSYYSCSKDAGDASNFPASHWTLFTYDAADYCAKPSNTQPGSRKNKWIPNEYDMIDFYDPDLGGFNIGRYAWLEDGSLTPVPDTTKLNLKDMQKCVDQQQKKQTVTGFVNMGTVNMQLKCHKQKNGMLYFNLCVTRDNIERIDFVDGAMVPVVNRDMVFAAEMGAKTSGWCATDNYKAGSSVNTASVKKQMQGADFVMRPPNTANVFTLAQSQQ